MCVLQCNTQCNKPHDGAEAGVPRRAAELRKAEAVHGELHKFMEDSWAATYNGISTHIHYISHYISIYIHYISHIIHYSVYLGSFMCQPIEEFLQGVADLPFDWSANWMKPW